MKFTINSRTHKTVNMKTKPSANPKPLPKPRAKGSCAAETRVRQLQRQVNERDELLDRFDHERKILAKLAAETPQFYNPLVVMEAKQIRDRILALPNDRLKHGERTTQNYDIETRVGPKASAELRCMELLAELDAQYKRFNAVRHTSIWGGSFEREHGAALEIKPIVNKMFDTLIKLLEARSANAKLRDAGESGAEQH